MERHHEKRRDMARSILPSKNREVSRRTLAQIKRSNRRAIAQDLSSYTGVHVDPDIWDEGWDDERDLCAYPDIEIGQEVGWRREGDKVNHFVRWAIATTKDVPVDDRLSQLRRILPGGLIGDHAMSHLERERDLRPPRQQDQWRWYDVYLEAPRDPTDQQAA